MKRASFLLLLLALFSACETENRPKPLSEPGEKLYVVRGVILSRDATSNTVNLDHEPIPGFMEAMVMDYSVRGEKVGTLPADKTRIEAKLHVTDRGYWITDVKAIK
ncbi:MAG TPA: copper-binding protein [Thermoanaerobaculia bacterium]|nr:copper-binding protein [Thermoanaerobaculia bacterium]